MKKKIYLSIPISGKDYAEQFNHAFNTRVMLEMNSMEVVTPFDIIKNPETPYPDCMGACVKALLECDGIFLCKGWQESKGCKAELQIALAYDMEIMLE